MCEGVESRNARKRKRRPTVVRGLSKEWGIMLIWLGAISKGDSKNDWMPTVPVKRVLAIWGMIRGVTAAGRVCQPVDKPEKATKDSFFQFIVFASLMYLFTIRWGILGTTLAVLLSAITTRIISKNHSK